MCGAGDGDGGGGADGGSDGSDADADAAGNAAAAAAAADAQAEANDSVSTDDGVSGGFDLNSLNPLNNPALSLATNLHPALSLIGLIGMGMNAAGAVHDDDGVSDPSSDANDVSTGVGSGAGIGDAAALFANAASARPVPVTPPAPPEIDVTPPRPVVPPARPPSARERQAGADAAARERRKRAPFGFRQTKLTGPLGLQGGAPVFRPSAIPGLQLGTRLGD